MILFDLQGGAMVSPVLASDLQLALSNWSTCTKWSQYAQSMRAVALAISPNSTMIRAVNIEISNRSP